MSEAKCPRTASDVPALPPPEQGAVRSREELERLRDASDVYYAAAAGRWVFTRYEDIVATLRDERLSVDPRKASPQPGTLRLVPLAEMGNMTFVDAPDHTRLRKLVAQVFTPRFAETLREAAEALAARIVAGLPENEPFDFVTAVARPMSLRVVSCLLIGLSEEDLPALVRQLPDLSQTFNAAYPIEKCAAARVQVKELWARVIGARRAAPRDDFVSMLLAAQDEAKVTESELLEMLTVTFVAGNMSTAEMMNNTLFALLSHPEELAKVRSHPALTKNAVEEALRLEGPIAQVGRIIPEDLEVRGCAMRGGESVALLTAIAARAADVNAEPDRFDVTRENIKHLGFGGGQHICIGAPLARLETEIVVNAVLKRFPALHLDPARPPKRKSVVVNGLEDLWVIP